MDEGSDVLAEKDAGGLNKDSEVHRFRRGVPKPQVVDGHLDGDGLERLELFIGKRRGPLAFDLEPDPDLGGGPVVAGTFDEQVQTRVDRGAVLVVGYWDAAGREQSLESCHVVQLEPVVRPLRRHASTMARGTCAMRGRCPCNGAYEVTAPLYASWTLEA